MAVVTLTPVPPFRLDLTVWVLRRLPMNQMDRWDGKTYRRVLMLGDTPVEMAVVQGGSERAPQLTVTAGGVRLKSKTCEAVISMLDKMLGLSVDLRPFRRLAKGNQHLSGLIDPFIGFKPPRLPSVFETLVNGIACQQLSLQVGMHLLNRLCRAYGLAVGENHAFPRPIDLAFTSPAQLRRLGFSGNKSLAILAVARAIVGGYLNLEDLAALDSAEALADWLRLRESDDGPLNTSCYAGWAGSICSPLTMSGVKTRCSAGCGGSSGPITRKCTESSLRGDHTAGCSISTCSWITRPIKGCLNQISIPALATFHC